MRLAAFLCALTVAGCGLSDAEKPRGVSLVVTREFGTLTLAEFGEPATRKDETVLELLQRLLPDTRARGDEIAAVKGLDGPWALYVNGSLQDDPPGEIEVEPGDHVLLDRDAVQARAIVGSYPAPFRSGAEGKRYPTRIDCGRRSRPACDAVRERLAAAGVRPVSLAGIPGSTGIETVRLVVGLWTEVRRDPTVQLLDKGPAVSGVFVRIDDKEVTLLDRDGRAKTRLGAGTGLVAATSIGEQQPTWVVTGVDEVGVNQAVQALEEGALAEKFAVAISDGRAHAAPVVPPPK